MKKPGYIPGDYPRIAVVGDTGALCMPFGHDAVNCRVLPRPLSLDFAPLARCLVMAVVPGDQHADLPLPLIGKIARGAEKEEVRRAAQVIVRDMESLSARFNHFRLRVVARYDEADAGGPHGLHADPSSIVSVCYTGPTTQYARNEDAVQTGSDPVGVRYALREGARRHGFRPGDFFHSAGLEAKPPGEAFIHHGPNAPEGAPPRLFLYGFNMRLSF